MDHLHHNGGNITSLSAEQGAREMHTTNHPGANRKIRGTIVAFIGVQILEVVLCGRFPEGQQHPGGHDRHKCIGPTGENARVQISKPDENGASERK